MFNINWDYWVNNRQRVRNSTKWIVNSISYHWILVINILLSLNTRLYFNVKCSTVSCTEERVMHLILSPCRSLRIGKIPYNGIQ